MDLKTELRHYLNTYEEDDQYVEGFIMASIEYLENAGVKANIESSLYKLAIKMLVAHWYDNRGVIGDDKEIPFGVNAIINQLQLQVVNGNV